MDGWSETDSPYNEHTRHWKECELVRLDLTPNRVATFVHGYWPHSQNLLPHTVRDKSGVIVVLRWHKLDSTTTQGMSKMTLRCASSVDLPWMDGKLMIVQGKGDYIKLLLTAMPFLDMSMKSVDPGVHSYSPDKSIDQPVLNS